MVAILNLFQLFAERRPLPLKLQSTTMPEARCLSTQLKLVSRWSTSCPSRRPYSAPTLTRGSSLCSRSCSTSSSRRGRPKHPTRHPAPFVRIAPTLQENRARVLEVTYDRGTVADELAREASRMSAASERLLSFEDTYSSNKFVCALCSTVYT